MTMRTSIRARACVAFATLVGSLPFSYAEKGEIDRAREMIGGAIERRPDEWQGYYNAACFEVLYGDKEVGIRHLQRAHELNPERVSEAAAKDSDFDAVHDDPRFGAITGG